MDFSVVRRSGEPYYREKIAPCGCIDCKDIRVIYWLRCLFSLRTPKRSNGVLGNDQRQSRETSLDKRRKLGSKVQRTGTFFSCTR